VVELIDPSVFKNLPQVTSTISFGPNGPTNDGLYSKIIFGDSLQANTFNFAYINLGTKIMNPELYLNISKIDPLLKKLIDPSTPTIKGQLQNGVIIPSENGKRGLGWLYSVWDQIDFKKYTKYSKLLKDNIIDMSKITKEMAFLDKWLVIPPIYRPYVEDKKRPGHHILTVLEPVFTAKTKDKQKDIYDMMASLTSLVEQHIRDYPEEWFWLHDRWKYVERKKKEANNLQ